MGIPIELERDFRPAIKQLSDRLDKIEQALIEISACKCNDKPAPKPLPKKVK